MRIQNFFHTVNQKYLRFLILITSDPLKVADFWRRCGVQIGDGTYVYHNVAFGGSGTDPITVGRNCVLTGCTILGHDASTNILLGIPYGAASMRQRVIIEDDCFIGHGSIILMGVRVGKGSIVGAGAVVTKDVPPGNVVVGNPAKVVCSVVELVERRRKLATEHPEIFPFKPNGE